MERKSALLYGQLKLANFTALMHGVAESYSHPRDVFLFYLIAEFLSEIDSVGNMIERGPEGVTKAW